MVLKCQWSATVFLKFRQSRPPGVYLMRWKLDIFNFELTADDMEQLKTLDENRSMWAAYDDPMIVQYAMETQ